MIASSPAASAPSAPGSGAVSCGGGAACGGGGGAGGSSGGGSASASPAPAAPAAPEEPSTDPSQPSDPTDSEDEDNGDMDKPDSNDPGSEDASLTLPEDSAATPAASSVPARARLFSLPVKMLGATAATYAAAEESGVSATADTETPTTWEYGWNSENKCVTLNSKDVTYGGNPVSVTTSGGTCNIEPDGNGNYANTVFNLSNRPSLIQAVDAGGNVNEDAHVSIKLIAASKDASRGRVWTDFKGIDTVHVAYNEVEQRALRLRMNNSSAFLCATGATKNSLFVSGGQLWLDGSSSPTSEFTVRATLYLGGSSPKYPDESESGLDCDVRAEGLIRFERTINLIGNASIVGLVTTNQSNSLNGDEKVEFLYTSRLYGNNYDLTFSGANLGKLTGYKNSPFKLRAGSRFENVKSLIIGGIGDTYGAAVLDIMAPDHKSTNNPYLGVRSLRVGQGSVVNVADGVTHLYFSGKDSAADYDKKWGLGDYSVLLLKDASKGASVMNVAEKASISCSTDNMKHSDGTVIGQVTGALAVDVASDGTLSISGGTAAETEGYDTPKTIATGKAGDNCSTLENLKLELKDASALVLNDIILGEHHALQGNAETKNSLKLNNVTIGLANNYTTQSVATLAEGGPLNLKATGGGEGTLTIDDTASILTINYGGMENLTFADDGTLVLDFANMGLDLGEHKYVAVVFDDTVDINPEKVTVTGISGPLDNTGYYLPVADGVSTNVVYFLAPEPASAVLCLFGLAAGAARRRRKQK